MKLVLWRVPKPKPGKGGKEDRAGEKTEPHYACELGTGCQGTQQAYAAPQRARGPGRRLTPPIARPPALPPAPRAAVVFQRIRTGRDYPEWEVAGVPLLLPLGRAFADGGRTAEKAMVERLLGALAPLRKPAEGGAAPPRPSKVRGEGRRARSAAAALGPVPHACHFRALAAPHASNILAACRRRSRWSRAAWGCTAAPPTTPPTPSTLAAPRQGSTFRRPAPTTRGRAVSAGLGGGLGRGRSAHGAWAHPRRAAALPHLRPAPAVSPHPAVEHELFFKDRCVFLRADWAPQYLVRYDAAALATPAVHASASPEAMQPTLNIIEVKLGAGVDWGEGLHRRVLVCSGQDGRAPGQLLTNLASALLAAHRPPACPPPIPCPQAQAAWAAKTARAKALPQAMVEELKMAARAAEPGVEYPAVRRAMMQMEPIARLKLDLVPSSQAADEKAGRAVFEVRGGGCDGWREGGWDRPPWWCRGLAAASVPLCPSLHVACARRRPPDLGVCVARRARRAPPQLLRAA